LIALSCIASSGAKGPKGGEVRFPGDRDDDFEKQCELYLLLTGRSGRRSEDIVRNPRSTDVLNWLVGVTPEGEAFYIIGAQPQFGAHENMRRVLDTFKDPRDERDVVVIGAGEAFGDHAVMNDHSG